MPAYFEPAPVPRVPDRPRAVCRDPKTAPWRSGTGAVIPALAALGDSPESPAIRRAVQWLEEVQNPDGGWGEDMRSYVDDAFIGCGDSTASQTGWALLALLAAKERSPAVERGIA